MIPDYEELVRERAYLMWEDEGRPEGCAERHWIAAEQAVSDEQKAWTSPANGAPGEVDPSEGAGPYARPGDETTEPLSSVGKSRRRA